MLPKIMNFNLVEKKKENLAKVVPQRFGVTLNKLNLLDSVYTCIEKVKDVVVEVVVCVQIWSPTWHLRYM